MPAAKKVQIEPRDQHCGMVSPWSLRRLYQLIHFLGDQFLDRKTIRGWQSILIHVLDTLVSALFENPEGRNIRKKLVVVSRHPRIVISILLFKSKAVVDDRLASQCNES